MKLNALDLNLLLVFDAIFRTQGVTLASEELGLTQSSVSNALGRLRDYFQDPLFVRIQGAMQPTPFAQNLADPVKTALGHLRQAIEEQRQFNPATSQRMFSICTSEVGQRVFLPKLLAHLHQVAPTVSVSIVDTPTDRIDASLTSGEIDLAVGFFGDFGPNFYIQRLFREHYVVMIRENHSKIKDTLTLDTYLNSSHISYLPSSASHDSLDQLLDREFSNLGVKRQVGLRVAHSMGLSSIVSQTDLMVTIPSRLAETFKPGEGVRVLPLPIDIGMIDIRQHWHTRFHQDSANQWLRAQFQQLFQQ
jgi:DNA-binding transcriptional LysR family regulator